MSIGETGGVIFLLVSEGILLILIISYLAFRNSRSES